MNGLKKYQLFTLLFSVIGKNKIGNCYLYCKKCGKGLRNSEDSTEFKITFNVCSVHFPSSSQVKRKYENISHYNFYMSRRIHISGCF